MIKSRTFIATPPGATIKEQLQDRGLSQKEFALRMGMSEKHISNLINGDVRLTPEVAFRLEMVLGIPAKFWNNLESVYRDKIIKANAENEMDADIELMKKFPYREMERNEWVPHATNSVERVINLRQYFGVAQLAMVQDSRITRIACRRLSETEKADFALIAWAQKAKLECRSIQTGPIDLKHLHDIIPEIREMTVKDPSEFCSQLTQMLAECGIALVFLPHIGGSFLHGATFYEGQKIVVGLTVRGRDADRFWFSLFHELAHILKGHINQLEGTSDEDEDEANQFAKNTLIDIRSFESFVEHGDYRKDAVIQFADSIGIDRGIVVGRLQKEGYIPFNWFNDLKKKYVITN